MVGWFGLAICRLIFLRHHSYRTAVPGLSRRFVKQMNCYLTSDIGIVLFLCNRKITFKCEMVKCASNTQG